MIFTVKMEKCSSEERKMQNVPLWINIFCCCYVSLSHFWFILFCWVKKGWAEKYKYKNKYEIEIKVANFGCFCIVFLLISADMCEKKSFSDWFHIFLISLRTEIGKHRSWWFHYWNFFGCFILLLCERKLFTKGASFFLMRLYRHG